MGMCISDFQVALYLPSQAVAGRLDSGVKPDTAFREVLRTVISASDHGTHLARLSRLWIRYASVAKSALPSTCLNVGVCSQHGDGDVPDFPGAWSHSSSNMSI